MAMMFSVRFYADDSKKCTMSTSVYGTTEQEAKARFKARNPKAVIISFIRRA